MELLDIVNEQDEVIGQASREECHRKGLLHRIIHVHLFNDNGDILFQRRGVNVDTFPGLLDAAVGGHLASQTTYQQAALEEAEEELGLTITPSQLIDLGKIRGRSMNTATHIRHHILAQEYAYRWNGQVAEIRLEAGNKATDFVWVPYLTLISLTPAQQEEYIRVMFQPPMQAVFKNIFALAQAKTL